MTETTTANDGTEQPGSRARAAKAAPTIYDIAELASYLSKGE